MTEQFYINGVLMDQASGKSASLVYQSPFFTDIDNIVSNRTNSVDFPTTEKNLSAIQNAHLPAGTSKFAYRKHSALYFRDGVQIFSGFGTLLSITPTAIKFSFTWGNVNAFQKLLDIKLRSLQTANDYVDWNNAEILSNNYYPMNVAYSKNGWHGSQYVSVGHTHPMLKVSDILTRLQAQSGITFSGHSVFNNLAIPILNMNADDKAKEAQGINLVSGDYDRATISLQYFWRFGCDTGAGDRDLKGQFLGNGAFDVTEYNKIRIILRAGSKFKTYRTAPSGIPVAIRGINVYACDEDGLIGSRITQIPMSWNDLDANRQRVQYSVSEDKVVDIDLNWASGGNTGKYNYIQLVPFSLGTAYNGSLYDIDVDIDIVCGYDEEQKIEFGGIYPLYANLPDWTASQLLKNLMKIRGVFATCPDEHTIHFISIDKLYENRSKALDWTDKLMLTSGTKPDEMSPTFGSYGQDNMLRWAEDKTNTQSFDGSLKVDNETLDAEKELLKLDFAGTEYVVFGVDESLTMNCYSVNPDGDGEAEEFTDPTPRIFEVTGRVASFVNLDFKNAATGSYRTYQQTIAQPRVLKAKILVDALDLQNLDLSVPIYSFALGHYYAINKLTTKDGYTADAELLQLGQLDVASEEVPTSEDISSDLVLIRNEDGTYYASIPSLTGTALELMIADNNYRVCILRYGYVRRGKRFQYYDNRNKKVWSHTQRRSGYRYDRKGLTWRIIGRDILYEGSQPAHSQQTKTGYYNGSTLVFKLKDTIVLPNMRTGQRRFVTRDGRIRNRACDGLNELFIALFHKEDKTWKRVSNILQVRGRTTDKTAVWEFEESNIVLNA